MKKTILAVLLTAATAAGAMEISLEENRGQRGSIGYVDLQAVFRRFPEVGRAKQSYAEIVRQAEEQVNLKKAELIGLRADISSLKAERDAASRAPLYTPPPAPAPVAPPPSPEPAPAPEPPAKAQTPPAEPASPLTNLPGMSSSEPLRISIPGMPEETLSGEAAATPAAPAAPAPAAVPAPAPAPAPTAAELQAQAEEQLRRRDAKVKELDAAVAAKEAVLASKQAALGGYQAQVEKDLVNIESKRSELLLGRIYTAVKETAVENGVSVVIDKTAILFGQGSVDLTDKVLKKLEGALP